MVSALENLNVKIESADKEAFIAKTNALGTTPSNAIRMFVKAFNARGGFPFDVSRPYQDLTRLADVPGMKGIVYDPEHGKYLPSFLNDDKEDDGLYDDLVEEPFRR